MKFFNGLEGRMFQVRRAAAVASVSAVVIIAVSAQQAPDRAQAPAVGPPPAIHVPTVVKRKLLTGIPVWIVPMHKVPVVHVRYVNYFAVTGSNDTPGLASMTADMLDEGAGSRTALQIADEIDSIGADLTASADWDALTVDLHVPVARMASAIAIMGDVVLRPTFPEKELARLKEERLAALLEAEDDPEELIRYAFPRVLYGASHPYGNGLIGTTSSIKSISVQNLRAFYEHALHTKGLTELLVVSGDVTAGAVMPLLEKAFHRPQCCGVAGGTPWKQVPQRTARSVYLIDKPGAAQSQIRIGWLGVSRSTPDYFSIRVLNTILGEAFTSRLNMNLREVHGYAYGASSRFDMRRGLGPFYAAAGVQTDKTAEALKEFFVELEHIHQIVGSEELEKAKRYLALQLPRRFETTRDVAASFAQLYVYDLPLDYYETYAAHVAAVTAEDVKRAADTYIQPDKFAVVIVGDRKAIEPGVRALNLGPVTVIEPPEIVK
jgi:predicted Zn-dependent peptidase